MLKKRLGVEAIESSWSFDSICSYYRIPSTLIIPKDCARIGDWAFANCRNLKEVVISEGVKEIGLSAFRGCCRDLVKVVIPGSVRIILDEAFCYCYEATIILGKPESEFKYIGKDAFFSCNDVKEETRN